MFVVYVIQSQKDSRLYKGFTKDIEKRLKQHNSGKTKSTKAYLPWVLVYSEKVFSRVEARKREKYLKSGIGRDYLKEILKKAPQFNWIEYQISALTVEGSNPSGVTIKKASK